MLNSVEDVALRVMTRHPRGGVIVGGSVYADNRQGLIFQDEGTQQTTSLLPNVMDSGDVVFTTPKTGWRLDVGTLYSTRDGGACWRKVFRDKGLNKIFFVDARHGWLGGVAGIVYHTDDGGLTWSKQNTGTGLRLKEFFFIDALHGWAIEQEASGRDYPPTWETALTGTRDGGRTWEVLTTEKTIRLYSVFFVNMLDGWGIDSNSNIVRTLDGGKTWDVQRPGGGRNWGSIFFLNEREGWVAGDGILHTKDGGRSWRFQLRGQQPESPYVEEILFIDKERGWALSTQQLLHTNDGGATWRNILKHPLITASRE